jgi:hypothetical protein
VNRDQLAEGRRLAYFSLPNAAGVTSFIQLTMRTKALLVMAIAWSTAGDRTDSDVLRLQVPIGTASTVCAEFRRTERTSNTTIVA